MLIFHCMSLDSSQHKSLDLLMTGSRLPREQYYIDERLCDCCFAFILIINFISHSKLTLVKFTTYLDCVCVILNINLLQIAYLISDLSTVLHYSNNSAVQTNGAASGNVR